MAAKLLRVDHPQQIRHPEARCELCGTPTALRLVGERIFCREYVENGSCWPEMSTETEVGGTMTAVQRIVAEMKETLDGSDRCRHDR